MGAVVSAVESWISGVVASCDVGGSRCRYKRDPSEVWAHKAS